MSNPDNLSQNEIDNLLSSLTNHLDENEADVEYTPSFLENLDEDKKGYKLYNFRRPDKFSKDHLKVLQDIHKEFSRQLSLLLSAYLRFSIDIEVVSVDQLTYEEFTRSLPSPITVCVLELSPLPGQIIMSMSHEVTFCIVDRMLGGPGTGDPKPRELTDIEEALVKRVFEKMANTLESAWKGIFPVRSSIVGVDNNAILPQLSSPGEITALTTLEFQIADSQSGLLSLCFPYPVLETVLEQLNSQQIFRSKGVTSSTEDRLNILQKLHNSKFDVNVVLGSTEVTMKDFLDLRVGDVLRLDNSVKDELIVNVNHNPKFLGRPGTKKTNYAVTITNEIEDLDNIKKLHKLKGV